MTARASTAIRVGVGGALLGIFAASQFIELRAKPYHPWHVGMFSLGMVFAAILTVGRPALVIFQRFVVIAGPYVPLLGGRRAGDPPVPPVVRIDKPRRPKKGKP